MPRRKEYIDRNWLLQNFSSVDPNVSITPAQVAALTGLGIKKLDEMRGLKKPPIPWFKDGGSIMYRVGDVQEYNQRMHSRVFHDAWEQKSHEDSVQEGSLLGIHTHLFRIK